MIPGYEIRIKNRQSLDQSYSIFSKPPAITSTGAIPATLWSSILANLLVGPGGTGVFEMTAQWSAINAYKSNGPGTSVVKALANNAEPVSLGCISPFTNEQVLGSTVVMSIKEVGIPRFLQPDPPASGKDDSFALVTDDSFTIEKAQESQYLIGVGGVRVGKGDIRPEEGFRFSPFALYAPIALFTPQPGIMYEITPTTTYWIVPGNFGATANDLVDSATMGQPFEIAFTSSTGGIINVEHEQDGRFVIVGNQ